MEIRIVYWGFIFTTVAVKIEERRNKRRNDWSGRGNFWNPTEKSILKRFGQHLEPRNHQLLCRMTAWKKYGEYTFYYTLF